MNRAQADRRIVTAVEHDCVHQAAPDAFHLPVDQAGIVEERALREALGDDRAIVAIQAWNSETGVAQPVERQASIVHEAGGLLLVDAAQSAGKAPLPAGADMVITSAHKLGGPVGIGALLVKDYAMLDPSGGHERGYRRGTENLPGALGFAAALEAIGSHYLPGDVARGMPALLKERLVPAGAQIVPQASDPNPHIIALSMPGLNASAQVMRFDMAGIAVSQGSACSSGTMKTSRVLSAMRVDEDIARNTIRISPGWNTTFADLEQFCDTWLKMARSA
jgi:cysteine desulfurase